MKEIGGRKGRLSLFLTTKQRSTFQLYRYATLVRENELKDMNKSEFEAVLLQAAAEKGCKVVEVLFDDDENVFEVTIDREDGQVDIDDCEYVHRAILAAFDRNVEDYSLTVSSVGLSPEEADKLLETVKE